MKNNYKQHHYIFQQLYKKLILFDLLINYLTWKNIADPHFEVIERGDDAWSFLNMFCTQNLREAHFSDLHRDLFFLRLLKSIRKRNRLPKKHQLYSESHFWFLQWKLHLFKFSTWNKKSNPNINLISSLTHNGNQP